MSTAALDHRIGDLATRLNELEKKDARRIDDWEPAANDNSLARKLVATESFKELNGGRARGVAVVESAALTSGNTTVGTGRSQSTSLVQADRVPGVIAAPQRKMVVRDLIASGQTGSNSIEYVKETGFTNNAAMVEETTAKPYSELTFDMTSAPVRTLAHLFKASKQILDDADGLISYIDLRARYGLQLLEEQQILFGSGTGQNLFGIVPQATAYSAAFQPAAKQRIDVLRLALLQVRKAEYRASAIVMSPDDWAAIELTKDAGGNYIKSDPTINNGQNLWGIPVVDSAAMPVGKFLVGAFDIAAQLFDRQLNTLEVSTSNVDDFEKNMCTLRCEERLALAVYRPASFVYGDFAVAIP